jgi:cytochrome c oxidase assembly protein subunit 11
MTNDQPHKHTDPGDSADAPAASDGSQADGDTDEAGPAADQDHQKIVTYMVGFILAMFAFGWGSIFLYNLVCKQIDPGGTASKTGLDQYKNVKVDESRDIEVRFMANVNGGLPWDFYPVNKTVTVHPGERKLVNFISKNNADRDILGKAIYDIQPAQAGGYFKKNECFCFQQQTLDAGQRREMPLNFWIDPNLPDSIDKITLAYTFFNSESSRDRAKRQHTTASPESSQTAQAGQ